MLNFFFKYSFKHDEKRHINLKEEQQIHIEYYKLQKSISMLLLIKSLHVLVHTSRGRKNKKRTETNEKRIKLCLSLVYRQARSQIEGTKIKQRCAPGLKDCNSFFFSITVYMIKPSMIIEL
jgi:hypothetical protein